MPRAGLLLFVLPGGLLLALLHSPALPEPSPVLLRGVVQDDSGPVAGATVRVKGSVVSTLSDAAGRFRLPATLGTDRLTAWKEGYLIAGQRGRRPLLRLAPLPRGDHEGYAWVDPTPAVEDEQRCGNCHAEIQREWAGGAHARSATGKHFRNLYDGSDWHGRAAGWSLLTEHPNGAGVCASCHAPTVREDDPALFDLRQVRGVAGQGVHCDYCHKIAGLGAGQIGLTHGRFLHRLQRPAEGQLFFGPLDDVDRGEDAFSSFYRDSRYCAACHEGVVFGVHVYTTYSEWRQSPARQVGLHCQSCHMKPTGRMVNIAPGHGGIDRDPRTLANHLFWDGSQEEMLRRCLQLDMQPCWDAAGLEARVTLVARGAGHRVPTGFIDRQVILVVEGFTAAGLPAALLRGPTLPSAVGADLAGKPGRLYARILKDEAGRGPLPFWLASGSPEDTRLLPEQPDVRKFTFAKELARLRVRVLHRRFWAAVANEKRWPDRDLVVIDRTVVP
jgi:hypothetical protein